MLFNECEPIVRDGQRIFLAGVDDPHFYRADDIEKAASKIPSDAFSILLAHTPEVYDRAMSARFISCYADTPTEVSFAYPAEFRSSWRPHYLDSWAPDHGAMAPCRIYLGGRWHEPSARPLKLPAGDNSAYLARWAAALAHEQVRCRKTKREVSKISRRDIQGMTALRHKGPVANSIIRMSLLPPANGHRWARAACPKSANSRHRMLV